MRATLVLAAVTIAASHLTGQCTATYNRSMVEVAPAQLGKTASYLMTYDTFGANSAAGNLYVLIGSPTYAATTYAAVPGFNTFGCWRVDLSTAVVLTSGVLDWSGRSPVWDYPVPNNPALLGTGFDIQGVDVDGASTPNLTIADDEAVVLVSNPQVPAIVRWRTATGIRRTSASDTLEVIVEAHTSVNSTGAFGEGGVASVDFTVVANGGSPSVTSVPSPALHTPNHSDQSSPLGVTSGMARVWGYGITLDCNTLPQGTIVVTASVVSGAGTTTALPGQITLYNDKGSVDSRPCAQTIYVEPASPNGAGNDSNSGTSAVAPLATLQAALLKAAALTSGATGDVGGAHIVMLPTPSTHPSAPNPGLHSWAGGQWGITTPLHTSGDWWVTVEVKPGAYLERVGTPDTCSGGVQLNQPYHFLVIPGNGPGSTFRIRFILEDNSIRQARGGWIMGASSDVAVDTWIDGGLSGSAHHGSSKHWSVRFTEDDTQIVGYSIQEPNKTRRATCHTREGVSLGFAGWSDVQDVLIHDVTGIGLQSSSPEPRQGACNVLMDGQRYDSEVAGHVNSRVNGLVTVSVPTTGTWAGKMLITANSGATFYQLVGGVPAETVNIAALAQELIGSQMWGVRCTGFANSANNSATAFTVLDAGPGATQPWIVLDNTSAVAETVSAGGSAWMGAARMCSGYTYEQSVHPDIHQYNSDLTDVLHSHVAVKDFEAAQTWFTGGHILRRIALFNVSDGGGGVLRANMDGTILTDCLFHNVTMSGLWDFALSGNVRFPGTEFVNCVVGPASGNSNAFPSGATFIDSNHFLASSPLSGATFGTNSTTGTWFKSPQSVPFGLEPATPTAGNGSLTQPTAWSWGGSPSKGCWRNVGLFDWN